MAAKPGIYIQGLKELDRALGKIEKDLRTDLRTRLKAIGDEVAAEARAIARAKGLYKSGDLIRGITPYALTGRAGVRSTAVHGGYNYPGRLEWEGGHGRYGPRASLHPALDRREPSINAKAEQLLDELADDWSRRG